MKLSDFSIGDEFSFTGMEMRNRVTDIGTRTIAYIKLDQDDPRNYNGPPYSILEYVADEDDMLAISSIIKKDTGEIAHASEGEDFNFDDAVASDSVRALDAASKIAKLIFKDGRCNDLTQKFNFDGSYRVTATVVDAQHKSHFIDVTSPKSDNAVAIALEQALARIKEILEL